jgi:hypothetical protein
MSSLLSCVVCCRVVLSRLALSCLASSRLVLFLLFLCCVVLRCLVLCCCAGPSGRSSRGEIRSARIGNKHQLTLSLAPCLFLVGLFDCLIVQESEVLLVRCPKKIEEDHQVEVLVLLNRHLDIKIDIFAKIGIISILSKCILSDTVMSPLFLPKISYLISTERGVDIQLLA